MLQRTTVSLNKNYLNYLKLIGIQKQKKTSDLINEALRLYISKIDLKVDNGIFFDKLTNLKKQLKLDKKQLKKYIQKGRV